MTPATGTGNFAINLLRRAYASNPRAFDQFYRYQLFANEVMLMPYYIASLNIEHAYYELTGKYEPFDGICFVDTLDLAEGAQMKLSFMTERNTERVERQKKAPITVIIGNPPYNAWQLSENDNNKNRKYPVIDERVRETYAKDSKATNKIALADPYVKFFRWASDRLQGRDGVVCYVSNNSFVDQIAFDGMRRHLMEDFTNLYIVDLKGNIRKDSMRDGIPLGERNTVFGLAAMVGISIAVLVRNQQHSQHQLRYTTVDFRSTREEKFEFLTRNVEQDGKQNALNTIQWQELTTESINTWKEPENANEYASYLPIGNKETKSAKTTNVETVFKTYGRGVATSRDDMVYDFNRSLLIERVKRLVDDYNAEVDRYKRVGTPKDVDNFVKYDRIKWSMGLKNHLQHSHYAEFTISKVRLAQYRPFSKRYLLLDRVLNEALYQFPHIVPTPATERENRVICATGIGSEKPFMILISSEVTDLHLVGAGASAQCFPFYTYDEDGTNRRENITDWALAQFRSHYATLALNPSPSGQGTSQASASDSLLPEGEGLGMRVHDEAVYRARAAEVMTNVARELRQRQTPAEEYLWAHLRNRRLDNLKFRRQNPIENTAYVADFLCYEARLVVELDGGIHAAQAADDAVRQADIEAQGYKVLRFTNDQLFNDLESVLTTIMAAAQARIEARTLTPASETLIPSSSSSGRRESETGREITKWDIFYYVYALLHHPTYRSKFADNLKRELPRIPFASSPLPDLRLSAGEPANVADEGARGGVFWAFAEAGKKLADLHLNYETVEPYPLEWVTKPGKPINYRVEKMKFTKDNDLVYNDTLTLKGIPPEAFDYKLGNRSALHWLVDQYQVSTDKRSGITSDPNTYSDDQRYIVNLVERVTRVSVETVAIVNGLPALI